MTFFLKKKENYASTFCFCLVIDFVWKEENKAVTKKKKKLNLFYGGKRKRNLVLRESGFLQKPYFSNM